MNYQGTFPLGILPTDQFVRSAGDGTGACEVGNDEIGWTRYAIGDRIDFDGFFRCEEVSGLDERTCLKTQNCANGYCQREQGQAGGDSE